MSDLSLQDRAFPPALIVSLVYHVLGLALGTGLPACVPDILPPPAPDMGLEDPPLDPRSIFETEVKDQLNGSCQGCHRMKQEMVPPFLVPGMEYDSLVGYKMGLFLRDPEGSLLLNKGVHAGPGLNEGQTRAVREWLQAEILARGLQPMSTPATPSVAMRNGEFFVSLEKLVGDPLAQITFKMEAGPANIYYLTQLKLTAGPATGIHVKNPVFLIFSLNGSTRDPGNSLQGVDLTVKAKESATLGSGSVILTKVPISARLALAFNTIEQVNPMPLEMFQCKAFMKFDAGVKPTLQTCAALCHGMGATDPRSTQALGAFDMTAARSQDLMALRPFCLRTLGRVNLADPAKSVLVVQATPPEAGGTTNHPYKLPTYMSFTQAVKDWAAGEK
jgi:hypothetical protein